MAAPVVVGVAGGSGSGKTTVVRQIRGALDGDPAGVCVLHHDAYYRDFSHLPPERTSEVNFDHPDALETELMVEHLDALLAGRAVPVPVYDFTTHARTGRVRRVEPAPVIVVDGILVLAEAELRRRMDIRIFVDTAPDLRFIRRLRRDLRERDRTLDGVVEQYLETVRPMHLEFVEPSKRWADVIVPEGGHNRVAVRMLLDSIRALARGRNAHRGEPGSREADPPASGSREPGGS